MRHACSALCNEGGVQAVRLWHAGTVAAKALWGPAPGEPGVPSDGTPVSAGCKGGCHGHAGHGGQACERKKPHEDLHQAPAAAAQSAIAIRASDFSDHSAVSACAGCTHAMQLCCKALVAFTCEVAGARCTVPGGRWALPVRVSRRSTPRHGALPSRHVATGGPTAYQVHNFERLSRPFHRASLPRRKASEVIPCLATTKEMDMCQPPACTSAFSTRCRSREETFLSWLRCRCYWGNRASDQCHRLQRHGTMRGDLHGRQQLTTGYRLQRHTRKPSMPVQSGAA